MIIDLTRASFSDLAGTLFDHPVTESEDPWYFGDVEFEIAPEHQLRLLGELFHGAPASFAEYDPPQIEQGLWCMMGGTHQNSFCGLVWWPTLPLDSRLTVIAGIFPLYDRVLATYPYESIDFRHPDADPRRFRTIDYMAPDLLLKGPWVPDADKADADAIRTAFLDLFSRLLAHDAPVAQYAALHGLGHLAHEGRRSVIDRYLSAKRLLEPAQRQYAEAARNGDVL